MLYIKASFRLYCSMHHDPRTGVTPRQKRKKETITC